MSKENVKKQFINIITLSQLSTWSVSSLLDNKVLYNKKYKLVRLGDFLIKNADTVVVEDAQEYKRVKVKIKNGGVLLRDIALGRDIGTKKQCLAKSGYFIISRIDARNGAFGIIPDSLDGAIVTNDFPLFRININVINPQFLVLITTTTEFIRFAQSCSSGTTNRQRMDVNLFLDQRIPLPTIEVQNIIVARYQDRINAISLAEKKCQNIDGQIVDELRESLGIIPNLKKNSTKGLQTVDFKGLGRWDVWNKLYSIESNICPIVNISEVVIDVFQGVGKKEVKLSDCVLLKVKNILTSGKIDYDNIEFIDNVPDRKILEQNDIITPFIGEAIRLSKFALYEKGDKNYVYTVDNNTGVIRVNTQKIVPEFLLYILRSEIVSNQINEIIGGSTVPFLGKSNFNRIMIPLPPIVTQVIVVNKIKGLYEHMNQMKMSIHALKQNAKSQFEQEIFGA